MRPVFKNNRTPPHTHLKKKEPDVVTACLSVTSALRRWRQEFKLILGSVVNLKPAWVIQTLF